MRNMSNLFGIFVGSKDKRNGNKIVLYGGYMRVTIAFDSGEIVGKQGLNVVRYFARGDYVRRGFCSPPVKSIILIVVRNY